jgi:uncharacterized sulfatase
VSAAEKPNVIFILCDDLGWGDLGVLHQNASSHDKKFATPQLDAMARDGAQLRNHYCPAPVCAPSRASLLLGVHQGNCEVRDNQFDKELPNNHTLATVMKAAGYSTAIIGKYGLQGDAPFKKSKFDGNPTTWPGYPTKRGFDEFFGYVRHVDGHIHYPAHNWELGNSDSHKTPKEVWHNDEEISAKLTKCYTTDLFTAYAKHWIARQTKEDQKPFFVYLAYDTPHAALQVPSTAYPEGKGLQAGLQWIGEDGRMINTAQGEIDSYRYDEHTGKGWTDVEERFATMVKRIDDCVGDLLQTLRDLGIDENTLVVLSSDNGPHSEAYLAKGNYQPTSFQSYGPFDGIKRDTWEGGIRVPTLAWWPSKIPAGTIDTSPSQFHDWMATMADVADQPRPAVCDGVSLMPTMTASGIRDASTVYVEYAQNGRTPKYSDFEERKRGTPRRQMQVIMMDGYKGIRLDIQDAESSFEIYDLQKDPSELNNLAGTSPAMTSLQKEMKARVLRLRRSNDSAKRPYDNALMPALPKTATEPGFVVTSATGDFQYVPDFDSLELKLKDMRIIRDKKAFVEKLEPAEASSAYRFFGYLNLPESGTYDFKFQSETPSVVRVHETVLIDNDFEHDSQKSLTTAIRMEKGLHPFEVTILGGEARPTWVLTGSPKWKPEQEVAKDKWMILQTK